MASDILSLQGEPGINYTYELMPNKITRFLQIVEELWIDRLNG